MQRTDRDGSPLVSVDAEDAHQETTEAEIRNPLDMAAYALLMLEAAREEWKRQARYWSHVRAAAVLELKEGRTWAQVADILGVSEPTAWNIAHPKGSST